MLLRAVLSAQADRVSAVLGTRSGVEMRSGRAAAERIGAQIVLGGCSLVRPILKGCTRMGASMSYGLPKLHINLSFQSELPLPSQSPCAYHTTLEIIYADLCQDSQNRCAFCEVQRAMSWCGV